MMTDNQMFEVYELVSRRETENAIHSWIMGITVIQMMINI